MRASLCLCVLPLVLSWTPDSWLSKKSQQIPWYRNQPKLLETKKQLSKLPPLIYAGECRNLMKDLEEAGEGKRFVLTAGDCAETFRDFSIQTVMNQYRIILQMTLILMYGINKPIVKIGRLAGQFAKPRSDLFETLGNATLNSYQGDIINCYEFNRFARDPDPENMIKAYHQSCQTLNLLRALSNGGYASIDRIHNWNLEFVDEFQANERYRELSNSVQSCLSFLKSLDLDNADVIRKAEFYVGHEGLLLHYEEPLTRLDSTTQKFYDCSGHFLWIGERTRDLNGSHVEFFRGIHNPIGIKVSNKVNTTELIEIIRLVNPDNKKGKVSLITRMGEAITDVLPQVIRDVNDAGLSVVWICDPMHANTKKVANGLKTRFLQDIKREIENFLYIHRTMGTVPAGIHLELTGSNVTECIGTDLLTTSTARLVDNYRTLCDPRLNAAQSLELAFWLASTYKKIMIDGVRCNDFSCGL